MSSILCKLILQVTAKGWACAGGLWLEYRQACYPQYIRYIQYQFSTFPSSPPTITHEGQVAWAGAEWGWFALREGSKSPGSSSTAASPPSGIRLKDIWKKISPWRGWCHWEEGLGERNPPSGLPPLALAHLQPGANWSYCFTNHISQNPSEQSSGSEILYPTHLKWSMVIWLSVTCWHCLCSLCSLLEAQKLSRWFKHR